MTAGERREDGPPTSWLIERGQDDKQVPTVWWTGLGWETDANAALRFNSQAEANAYIEANSPIPSHRPRFGRAVEHGWLAATTERREDGWEELRREIEARHKSVTDDTGTYCDWCRGSRDWPCDASRLAAARGEPGLDVERLAFAIHTAQCVEPETHHGIASKSDARLTVKVAAEYAALLATPTTPEPDPDVERPPCPHSITGPATKCVNCGESWA